MVAWIISKNQVHFLLITPMKRDCLTTLMYKVGYGEGIG
jgi:hypothetical protein